VENKKLNIGRKGYGSGIPALKKFLQFFLLFFKMGFMAYGGPAMLGFIKKEVVFKRQLISEEDFNDGIALVNVIPGATNSQMVAYIGYKLEKGRGALIAFTAFIIPAFIEMLVFTLVYKTTGSLGLFMQVFKALEAVITAILLNTVIIFGSRIIKEWRLDILALGTLAMLVFKFNVIIILLIIVVSAFLLFLINKQFRPFLEIASPGDGIIQEKPGPQNSETSGTEAGKNAYAGKNINGAGKGSRAGLQAKQFFRIYWTFFLAAAIVAASLTAGFLIKRDLFLAGLSIAKASVIGFGGAIPMLTIIQYDMVNVLKIFSQKQIIDALVLGQITPGPIMITSTFIGYFISGFTGAAICTAAAFYPSFAIFSLVAPKYESVKNNRYVKLAVKGIMGMFVGMLLFFLYSVGREAIKGYISAVIALLSFIAIRLKAKEIYIIAAAAIISVALYFFNIKIN
jgi:chromate transporter